MRTTKRQNAQAGQEQTKNNDKTDGQLIIYGESALEILRHVAGQRPWTKAIGCQKDKVDGATITWYNSMIRILRQDGGRAAKNVRKRDAAPRVPGTVALFKLAGAVGWTCRLEVLSRFLDAFF